MKRHQNPYIKRTFADEGAWNLEDCAVSEDDGLLGLVEVQRDLLETVLRKLSVCRTEPVTVTTAVVVFNLPCDFLFLPCVCEMQHSITINIAVANKSVFTMDTQGNKNSANLQRVGSDAG